MSRFSPERAQEIVDSINNPPLAALRKSLESAGYPQHPDEVASITEVGSVRVADGTTGAPIATFSDEAGLNRFWIRYEAHLNSRSPLPRRGGQTGNSGGRPPVLDSEGKICDEIYRLQLSPGQREHVAKHGGAPFLRTLIDLHRAK